MRVPSLRFRTWRALALAVALPLFGCGAHFRGIVEVTSGPGIGPAAVEVRTPEGRAWHLRLPEDANALRALDGCTVQVEGRRLLRSFFVRSWQVLDAGDGSAPFVGEVYRLGVKLLITDKNSGMELVLVEDRVGDLSALEGHLVMVQGYIVGPQTVRLVSYRVLIE